LGDAKPAAMIHPKPTRLAFVLSLFCGIACGIGCGQLLGYDDLVPAERDASTVVDAIAEVSDAAPPNGRWPERPPGPIAASGKGKKLWLEGKHFYLGAYTHLGVKSPSAWREWGFDLDRVCTGADEAASNTGVCKRAAGAEATTLLDGDECRDNNFGSQLVRRVLSLVTADFEGKLNTSVMTGSGTWVFMVDDLDDGPDDAYAPGAMYVVGPLPGVEIPKFDGTDVRKAVIDSLEGSDLSKPVLKFPKGYVAGNVWVSGELAPMTLIFPVGKTSVPLAMASGIVTLALRDDHTAAATGVIAGALSIPSLLAFIEPIAASSGICPGTGLYDSVAAGFVNYVDLVLDAKDLQDPTKPCDGMSVGLGLDMSTLAPITEVMPSEPPGVTKCSDAGVDATTDAAADAKDAG
jgi:hypothetical protein